MSIELIKRALPYLIAIALLCGVAGGAYQHGVTVTNTTWQSRWDSEQARLSAAAAIASESARTEEQRTQKTIDEVATNAQKQIDNARADAVAANAAAVSLREQARRIAAAASRCPSNTSAATTSQTTDTTGDVLADLFSGADETAGSMAAAYDQARAAGLACEQAYDALQAENNMASQVRQ